MRKWQGNAGIVKLRNNFGGLVGCVFKPVYPFICIAVLGCNICYLEPIVKRINGCKLVGTFGLNDFIAELRKGCFTV